MNPNPILYIEDEEDYQILVSRILRRAGLDVETADTAEGGLEKLEARRPSLLILDINLPDRDGYAICRQLRQDPSYVDLPILMLTVRRRPEEWLQGFASGANDYISKPLNPPELVERVVNCLESSGAGADSRSNPEFQLIRAAVAGNRSAYEVLIEKYRNRIAEGVRQQVRRPQDVDDVVSFAFTRAYESLASFRGEASFFTWIYRIALNEAMASNRRHSAISLEDLTLGNESALPKHLAHHDAVHDRMDTEDSHRQVRQVLKEVPEPFRKMLELYFLRDMSYEEISRHANVPIGTVMSRLHKGRQLLQAAWELQAVLLK